MCSLPLTAPTHLRGSNPSPESNKCRDGGDDSSNTADSRDEEHFPIPELGDNENHDIVLKAEQHDFFHSKPKFVQVDWDKIQNLPSPPVNQGPIPTSQPQETELTLPAPVLATPKIKRKRLDVERTPTPVQTARSHWHKPYNNKDEDNSSWD